jgi:hypothetical protein
MVNWRRQKLLGIEESFSALQRAFRNYRELLGITEGFSALPKASRHYQKLRGITESFSALPKAPRHYQKLFGILCDYSALQIAIKWYSPLSHSDRRSLGGSARAREKAAPASATMLEPHVFWGFGAIRGSSDRFVAAEDISNKTLKHCGYSRLFVAIRSFAKVRVRRPMRKDRPVPPGRSFGARLPACGPMT